MKNLILCFAIVALISCNKEESKQSTTPEKLALSQRPPGSSIILLQDYIYMP